MHRIDEPERAPPSSGKALVRAPDLVPDYASAGRCRVGTYRAEKLVPYAVSEEHDGHQHADSPWRGCVTYGMLMEIPHFLMELRMLPT
jgi:hypothetical protein